MSARKMVRLLVLAIGVFYVVLAISGFASISDDTNVGGGLRGGNDPDLLWNLFGVTTVLNFIHFLFGALTIIAGFLIDRSKLVSWTMAGAFVALFAYDIISMMVRQGTDPLAVNTADAWLHAITAVVLIAASALPIANPAEHQGERARDPRTSRAHRPTRPRTP
ncbi:DUF4383 domain-containing protein [Kibdelosporangium persicum]|uniref:DUF4383 domain-containing protein n=1 Tax=Kibdelosporangium persicum TaxID=2698649 RepID=A0ABX2EYP6_9PSEU|nr:DUF4383 domain-containing protein [Kibdelosporangium persicum]NRN64134.1 hypothetical protein [Kibdelosporangium persicum]